MKLLGAALITAACLLYGLMYYKSGRERTEELDAAAAMLDAMAGELEARLTPLPELVARQRGMHSPEAERFLQSLCAGFEHLGEESFSQLWWSAACEGFKRLRADELKALGELGRCLGRYSVDRQLAALSLCSDLLRERSKQGRLEQRDKLRLNMGLACSSGALLVILLI